MRITTPKGEISIAHDVFTMICGYAATKCFGVTGMASRSVSDGIVRLLRKENLSKGVKISLPENGNHVNIELHIIVEHGVNMPAVCMSIINEVRYVVHKLIGVDVGNVDIHVDSIMNAAFS